LRIKEHQSKIFTTYSKRKKIKGLSLFIREKPIRRNDIFTLAFILVIEFIRNNNIESCKAEYAGE
jgi:hypothetical protein